MEVDVEIGDEEGEKEAGEEAAKKRIEQDLDEFHGKKLSLFFSSVNNHG